MDRKDITPEPALPSLVVSPSSSLFSSPHKRRRIPSDETDATSLSIDTNSHQQKASAPRRLRLDMADAPADTDQGASWELPLAQGGAWRYARVPASTPLPPGPMRSFGIEVDHPLVPVWPPLRDEIRDALECSGLRWYALEVYHRRRTIAPSGTDDTTIVVVARYKEGAWDALRGRVLDICAAHNQHELAVELINGSVERFTSPAFVPYNTLVAMGSSIVPEGLDWTSGSAGGYVELRGDNEAPVLCALSRHHVLRPTDTRFSEGNGAAVSHQAITKPDPLLRVEQPSLADHHAEATRLVELLKDLDDEVVRVEGNIELGIDSERIRQRLQAARERRTTAERLLSEVRSFDRGFGHVWATSGYRIAGRGCALDWGLVRVDSRRAGLNELPPSLAQVMRQLFVAGTGTIELGDRVAMVGRSSGTRKGFVSAIHSGITPDGLDGSTTEYLVTGLDGLAFAEGGDSGAFVLNMSGALVGLVWGGPLGEAFHGSAYVTPIAEVFKDIEERTGWEVIRTL